MVSISDNSCLDIYTTRLKDPLATFACHGMGGNQFFAFAKSGQIITAEELCVGVSDDESSVTLVSCSEHDSSQLWEYDDEVNTINQIQRSLKVFLVSNVNI